MFIPRTNGSADAGATQKMFHVVNTSEGSELMNLSGVYVPLVCDFAQIYHFYADTSKKAIITALRGTMAGILLLLAFAAFAFGQAEAGQIAGTVTDPSQAVIPGVTVTAENLGTGLMRANTTSSSGNYTLTGLPPGNYVIVIKAPGFAPFRQQVEVTVAGRTTVDASLALAGASTIVEVAAESAAQVNTQDQTLSNVVTSNQISSLPSLTRNPYDFVAIGGDVARDPNGSTGARGVGYAINGQRSASTDILLDGGENVDLFTAGIGQAVPQDSVQEYRVLTSSFTAEYGRAGGGVVNVATKSGTNTYHGSGYEYNRISALASNTFDEAASNFLARQNGRPTTPHDRFVRNQFGFSLGGPVLPATKDKLFFFTNTEWTRIRSQGSQVALVPTPQFIATTAANTQAFFNQFGKLRANAAPTGEVFTIAPATVPTLEEVRYSVPSNAGAGSPENGYQNVDRVDWNISSKTTAFVRYGLQKDNLFAGTISSSAYVGYDTGQTDVNQNGLISINHIFSPTILNNLKLEYNRLNLFQPLGTAPISPGLFLNRGNTASTFGGDNVILPGYLPTSPGNAIPLGGPQNIYQVNDDLTATRGNHTLKFGGQFLQLRDNRTFGAYETSVEQLGQSTTSQGVAALIAGSVYSFQGAINPNGAFPCARNPNTGAVIVTPSCTVNLPATSPSFVRENTFNDGAVYGQDTWKAASRLTLDLGLRWEYYGPQHNSNPNNESNFFFGSGNTFFDQIRNGRVLTTPNSPLGGLYQQNFKNFAPRVGFAYDIFGDGRWSVRGGYGIGYERNFGNVTYNVIQNPPAYAVISLISGRDVPSIAITNSNAGPLAGTGSTPLPRTSLRAVDPHLKTAYAQQYSLALEHEILPATVAAVEFTGSRGEHLYSISNFNKSGFGAVYEGDGNAYGTGPTANQNPNGRLQTQYSNINFRGSNGDSYYNALNLRLHSSNFREAGLQLVANYTYSHSVDDLSSTFSESGNNFNLGYLDPFRPYLDRGNSDFDTRHRFVFSGVYDPKFLDFKNSSSTVRNLVGGWEVAPIFVVRSGTPFTIFDCRNQVTSCPRALSSIAASGNSQAVAGSANLYNYLSIPFGAQNLYADPISGSPDIETCTGPGGAGCTLPVPGQGRNHYTSPGFYNLDLGIYKTFAITEKVKVQFRAEAYDVLNHHNFYVVSANSDAGNCTFLTTSSVNACNPVAGPITPIQTKKGSLGGTAGPGDERRNLQLALRFDF